MIGQAHEPWTTEGVALIPRVVLEFLRSPWFFLAFRSFPHPRSSRWLSLLLLPSSSGLTFSSSSCFRLLVLSERTLRCRDGRRRRRRWRDLRLWSVGRSSGRPAGWVDGGLSDAARRFVCDGAKWGSGWMDGDGVRGTWRTRRPRGAGQRIWWTCGIYGRCVR